MHAGMTPTASTDSRKSSASRTTADVVPLAKTKGRLSFLHLPERELSVPGTLRTANLTSVLSPKGFSEENMRILKLCRRRRKDLGCVLLQIYGSELSIRFLRLMMLIHLASGLAL
jgi:hypothetical protein